MPQLSATVNPADLASLQRKLATIAPPALEHIIAEAAPYLRDQAKATAPVATGALVSSLSAEATGMQARVRSPLAYALPQEFGRSVASRGGRGLKGRFFMLRALQMLRRSELPRLFNKAIAELESAWSRR